MKKTLLATVASVAMVGGAVQAQESLEMTSAFGKNLPILGTAAVDFANNINSISNDVEFEHFDPGKLVPTLEALDAVSNGSVDAAYATTGYWQGKINAASLFAAVPFGPEAGEFLGWVLYDDGAKYWQQMYDDNGYNVVAMPIRLVQERDQLCRRPAGSEHAFLRSWRESHAEAGRVYIAFGCI